MPVDPQLLRGLDTEQALAVRLAAARGPGALAVTGEAGSGKTEVLRVLAEALRDHGRRLVVLAVAHRALHVVRRRLSGLDNVRYVTLARVSRSRFALVGGDVVVVDEASMVSDRQLSAVIAGLDVGARLVLVGDESQLPPLSPGTPFKEALKVGVPAVRLRGQYRQDARSGVRAFAGAVRRGETLVPLPANVYLHAGLTRPEERMVRLALGGQQRGSLPLVLTWRRDDWLRANLALQQRLNPSGPTVATVVMVDTAGVEHRVELRIGDQVACTANLSALEFYNGMTGRLLACGSDSMRIRTEDGRVLDLPVAAAQCLELGYCLTVHRAQGGEWPHVLVYLPGEVRGYPREWYYTAVSRARHRLDVVSGLDREALWANMRSVAR